MRYEYYQPAPDLCPFVGSYYIIEMAEGGSGITRAEIPHIRFVLAGESRPQPGATTAVIRPVTALACGPSFQAGQATVSPGSLIVGASLTPLGWQALIGVPMDELANLKIGLDELRRIDLSPIADITLSGQASADTFRAVDIFFRGLLTGKPQANEAFIAQTLDWLLDPASPGIDELVHRSELSHRQIDRLCKTYFGASPKRLHRKFRALNIATELALSGEGDWRQVAGDQFYDQAHFIKDFKDLIGCTPGEFIRGPHMMMRFDLMKRLAIPHASRLSLIG